jgi:hypothetical protein
MADLTITAASVVPGSNANTVLGTAGETITAGQAVYKNSTSSKWMKADNNAASAEARGSDVSNTGIALTGSSLNQPIAVQLSGDITIGASLTAGESYYLSDTAGAIAPKADIATAGEYHVQLGIAKSTTVLALDIQYPDVAVPA